MTLTKKIFFSQVAQVLVKHSFLIVLQGKFYYRGKTVLYQTAPIMLDSILDYKFGNSSFNDVYNIINVDLLIIDDLGVEALNSFKLSELFNIINARLLFQNNHITKTIISTNLNMNNLLDTYSERIFSRIAYYYNVCRFFGNDIRLNKIMNK